MRHFIFYLQALSMSVDPLRFRTARLSNQLTQKQLAEKAGIQQSHISHIEKGLRGLSDDLLDRIAKILNVTGDYLCGVGPDVSVRHHFLVRDDVPAGLRALACDETIAKAMHVTDQEWHTLLSIDLPATVNRDGYLQLLFTIRAICQR